MAKQAIISGMLLTLLGVICYVFALPLGAEKASVTALIPMFLGVPLMLLGLLSIARPGMRMHFMHVAVLLALLGALASLGRLFSVEIKKPSLGVGPVANAIMAVICIAFVILSVRSFISARREREKSAS
jgi:hypothetical protein